MRENEDLKETEAKTEEEKPKSAVEALKEAFDDYVVESSHLVSYPSAMLRTKCKEVNIEKDDSDYSYHEVIDDMTKFLFDFNALGLAANQVGHDMRIVGIWADQKKLPLFMINPKITDKGGTMIGPEACLSFPGVLVDVKRSASITVEYYDTDGEKHTEDYFGKEAIVIQHEIDHLEGITLVQSASRVYRSKIMKDLKAGKRKMVKYAKLQKKTRKLEEFLKEADRPAAEAT